MSAAMPYVFAALAALALGGVVVSFYQALRAVLGLVDARDALPDLRDDDERALLDRRAGLLDALSVLDLDHAAGKLSDDDHAEEKQRLRTEAKAVIAALDALVGPFREPARALVEARRAASSTVAVPDSTPDAPSPIDVAPSTVEPEPAATGDSTAPSAEGVVCGACDTRNDADAAFCKRCGKALGGAA